MVETVTINGFRHYVIDGNYYPSVTSILSLKPNPGLERWKKRYTRSQIDWILYYTGIRGEMIHYMALRQYETNLITQDDPPMESIEGALEDPQMLKEIDFAMVLFSEFRNMVKLKPKTIETAVWNHEHKFAGRLDFNGALTSPHSDLEVPILMDIKTAKEVYKDNLSLQLSGYNMCLDYVAERLYCLVLHPGETMVGKVKIGIGSGYWDFIEVKPNYKGFLHYLKEFNEKYPLEPKK